MRLLENSKSKQVYDILKEDFWNPGKYFNLLVDMYDSRFDAKKWNESNQEERDAMVLPILKDFWNKYKEEMTEDDLYALFDDLEDNNYHTEYRLLRDIIYSRNMNESSISINESFSGEKRKRLIKTGLKDEKARDILCAVVGQLSDGIWENSPGMEKYWKFADGMDKEGNLVVYDGYEQETSYGYNQRRPIWYYSAFSGKSDDEVKRYFAHKIKQIVKEEGLEWNRNNTQPCEYLDYNSGVTVRDAYRVYDKLLGRIDRIKEGISYKDDENFDETVKRDFRLFLMDKYGNENYNDVTNEDVNEYFSGMFYDIEDEDDLDAANEAEDIIRTTYHVSDTDDGWDRDEEYDDGDTNWAAEEAADADERFENRYMGGGNGSTFSESAKFTYKAEVKDKSGKGISSIKGKVKATDEKDAKGKVHEILTINKGYKSKDIQKITVKLEESKKQKRYAVNIDWETDGDKKAKKKLPTKVEIPDDVNEDTVADWLSDKYGWLVNSVSIDKSLKEDAKIWSNHGQEEYYQGMSREDMIQEIKNNGWDEEEINGVPILDADDEDLRNYLVPQDIDLDFEDYEQTILPMIENQCYGDYLVLYGVAANWRGSGAACKAIKFDELQDYFFPNYDASIRLYCDDNDNLYYTEANHDTPMGGTKMYLYSFLDETDYNNAEKELQKLYDDESFDMYYFCDWLGYKDAEELIKSSLLKPIKRNPQYVGISESVKLKENESSSEANHTHVWRTYLNGDPSDDFTSFEEALKDAKENNCDEIEMYTWFNDEDYQNYKDADKIEIVWTKSKLDEGVKLSPKELVSSAYKHVTSDLGKEATVEAVLDYIVNNYDQNYFKGNAPGKEDFYSVRAILRSLGLIYSASDDIDENIVGTYKVWSPLFDTRANINVSKFKSGKRTMYAVDNPFNSFEWSKNFYKTEDGVKRFLSKHDALKMSDYNTWQNLDEAKKPKAKKEEKRVIMQQGNVTCFKENDSTYYVFENEHDNEVEFEDEDSAMKEFMERVGVNPNNELIEDNQ